MRVCLPYLWTEILMLLVCFAMALCLMLRRCVARASLLRFSTA